MGEHEGWSQPPSGLLPNGLLPNEAASVIRVLDSERWLKAEERTAELIACIQPNSPSEERRNAVAYYVQRLIMKCFPCKVFTFGSVPLKTYLPDGDIDLTAFGDNQNLKETWAHQVRDMLENEEKNENAEFCVKEVQYIQAEVKIIKCLVENIVVDISFNQLGGLCTLCFLEEVDHLINQNHLFKRSIILIKAWCYYESRILGAHHGLISTYALETLVLYIFHVFNNSFTGPLEVLYRFLEFFSKFDWDNFCVSLWGPVPINSLPDVTAKPPRKDGGELLLSKPFLHVCSYAYAVFPGGQENQGQPFVSKHFNVIDPLRVNNNLGRSVSKGNFFRIRSAFAFGAKRLARLLDCPKEDLFYEVNQFFMNTWERHGSGHRPDAPSNDFWRLRLSNPDNQHGSENVRNKSSGKRNDISSGLGSQADGMHGSCNVPTDHANHCSESTSQMSDISTFSLTQSQKSRGSWSNSTTSEQIRQDTSSNQKAHNDKGQRSSKPENLVAGVQGRFLFARTRSSPELTETYGGVSSQGRCNRAPESGKGQIASPRLENNRRKNLETDIAGHGGRSSTDDPSSVRHALSHQSNDASDSNNQLNTYNPDDLGMGTMNEEFSSIGRIQGMHQEEQDIVNMMASSTAHGFNGQVHFPLNLASGHLPLPIPPSVLASMGYAPRNFGGIVPTNVPLNPQGTNMQFPQGLVSPPLAHYVPGIVASNTEESIESGNENFGSSEMNQVEAENDIWNEQELSSNAGLDLDNGSFEMPLSDDKQQSTSAGYNFVPSSRVGGSGSSGRVQQKFTKETQASTREDHADNFQYQDNRGNVFHLDERTSSRSISGSHAGSLRSKTSSESSWEGSSVKSSKSAREKRGRRTTSGVSSAAQGKAKNVSEQSSQADDDSRDRNLPLTMGNEMTGGNTGAQSLHVPRHQTAVFEAAQTSGSDSLMPMGPVLLGPDSQPLTFYLAGPPVPFVTMLQFYNFPTGTGTSDASTSHFSADKGLDSSDSGQNFDSSEVLNQCEMLNTPNSTRNVASVEPSEHKSDILNSDFLSHWQNLQYGRFCQNSQHPAPLIYSSSPVMVPPVYLQGHFPLDGPGRPLSNNLNLHTQFMSYGSRLVPVAPLQSVSNRPASVYQQYADEIPRYRTGTGTYLPNPKVSARERHSASTRRGNYSHDRSYHRGEREGNWNMGSKARAAGRNHNRSQSDKLTLRSDRMASAESRTDRPWGLRRHDSFSAYQSQNGPVRSNSTQGGSANVAYGMYPVPTMNPSGVSSNGPAIPSVVMLYPYDHTIGYGSPAEQLEFGSLGQVGFSGMNELSQLGEGSQSGGLFDEKKFHGASGQHSSADQPSSPHGQRGL